MAEETKGTAAEPEPKHPQGAEEEPKTAQELRDEVVKLKAESRKWEERAKKNKEAADRLASLEEEHTASTNELEKATARAEKAESELAKLKAVQKRADAVNKAAKDHGVDAELLAAMSGEDDESIEANAKLLKEKFAKVPKYPDVNDSGTTDTPRLTKKEILSMKGKERFDAIKENASLFRKDS